jgi:riboflavin kinase/FMN adenylyltransferase
MNVAGSPAELRPGPRAAAVGILDGVHRGHRRLIEALLAEAQRTELLATVVVVDTGPEDSRLTTVERRLDLLAELGVREALVAPFTGDERELAERVLRPAGVELVVAASAEAGLFERLHFRTLAVVELEGVSTAAIRDALGAGDVETAARMLGRPAEVEGEVVGGDARGRALGFPTANLAVAPGLVLPANGIYAGAAAGHRAAISIGVNPHYGGDELRVEAFLLDFAGDLYNTRLRLELWRRLRDERAFASERELVDQIARDVEETRAAVRPA